MTDLRSLRTSWLHVEKRLLSGRGGNRGRGEEATAVVQVGEDGGLAWGMVVEVGRERLPSERDLRHKTDSHDGLDMGAGGRGNNKDNDQVA